MPFDPLSMCLLLIVGLSTLFWFWAFCFFGAVRYCGYWDLFSCWHLLLSAVISIFTLFVILLGFSVAYLYSCYN